jgi:hypothetical protein
MSRREFALRRHAEFVRWVRIRGEWAPEIIRGIPTQFTATGLLVKADGVMHELHRDEWTFCDSGT